MYEVYKDIADIYYSIANGDYVSKPIRMNEEDRSKIKENYLTFKLSSKYSKIASKKNLIISC